MGILVPDDQLLRRHAAEVAKLVAQAEELKQRSAAVQSRAIELVRSIHQRHGWLPPVD